MTGSNRLPTHGEQEMGNDALSLADSPMIMQKGCSIDTIARQSADISPGTNLQKRDRESHPHYYRQRLDSNGPEKQGVLLHAIRKVVVLFTCSCCPSNLEVMQVLMDLFYTLKI